MKLSIIIVNWNTGDLLKKCLDSIYQYTKDLDFEIFVIDNNSTDHSLNFLDPDYVIPNEMSLAHEDEESISRSKINHPEHYNSLHLIKNSFNAGFATANNQAIKQAIGEHILLLNPDTELKENSFSIMLDFMNKHPDCGILGPKLLNTDGSLQLSCRTTPTLLSQLLILTKIHNLFPHLPPLKKYYMLDFDHNSIKQVEEVMGACFLIRKKALEDVGLLDENFWLSFDEVDYSYRALQKNWKIYFTPQTSVYHHKGISFKLQKVWFKQKAFNASLLLFFRKHKPAWQWFTIWLCQPVSYLAVIFLKLLFITRIPLFKNKNL